MRGHDGSARVCNRWLSGTRSTHLAEGNAQAGLSNKCCGCTVRVCTVCARHPSDFQLLAWLSTACDICM
eukprot:9519703-Alexandrium_andersonii.AAC.1